MISAQVDNAALGGPAASVRVDVLSPCGRRVAAMPRRVYSVEMSRGDAAVATWIFNGDARLRYAIRRTSDNATRDIGVVVGVADADAVDAFCAGDACVVEVIYDQTTFGNHLTIAPARHGFVDLPVNATRGPSSLGKHKIYGAVFEQEPLAGAPKEVGVGYRNDNASGVAKGDEPETMYMVLAGDHYNDACCFDYGNAEDHIGDDGAATMEAISWTNGTWGMSHHGVGAGPWVMARFCAEFYTGPRRGDAAALTRIFRRGKIRTSGRPGTGPLGLRQRHVQGAVERRRFLDGADQRGHG